MACCLVYFSLSYFKHLLLLDVPNFTFFHLKNHFVLFFQSLHDVPVWIYFPPVLVRGSTNSEVTNKMI